MSASGSASLLNKLDRFGRAAENIALIGVLGSMVLVALLQIVLREFFGSGIIWLNELIRIMVLWLAMVGAVAACRDNRHIRIDLVSHLLPPRAVTAIRIVVDLFAAVVCAFLAWQVWSFVNFEVELEFTVLNGIGVFWFHVIAPLAFALMSYRFLVLVIQQIVEFVTPPNREQVE